MKVEDTDNVTVRIPHKQIPGQIAPVYVLGLPDDVKTIKAILEKYGDATE
jgi:hypothetical protein